MGFQQGLSGLRASSTALDVTSNNIANASTVGFKQAKAHFADMFAASLQTSASNQVGIGVNVPAVMQQFTQGNISSTSNPLDMAINGEGFFGMTSTSDVSSAASSATTSYAASPKTYSRNGQFHLDKNGYVIDDAGRGLAGVTATSAGSLTGQPIGPIKVQFQIGSAQATSTAGISANLDSGKSVIARTGASAVAFNQADPATYSNSTTTTVYDSLGNSHSLTYYFTKTAVTAGTSSTWEMRYALDGTMSASTNTLTFDTTGTLTTPAAPTQTLALGPMALTNGASPINITLDVGKLTQYGTAFSVTSTTQNGYEPGTLAGMNIGKDGTIQARYTNGQTMTVGQVMLYGFNNPNGLKSIGGNQWEQTSDSGAASAATAPSSGQMGVLQSMSTEDSNVDMTASLVDMIVQQRNYQANAQSIKVEDQIMQTLVNLR